MINDNINLEKVIAHRGASAYAPENTLIAFQTALDLGCHWIEFDVTLSQDGVAVVFHDDVLNRTTNGHGEITQASSAYIQTLDAGSWFHRRFRGLHVPTLKEVLLWLGEQPMQANIEIKTFPDSRLAAAVLAGIAQYWPKEKPWPLISSFDEQALVYCHTHRPDIPRAWLLDHWPSDWLHKARQLHCVAINVSHRLATAERIQHIIQAGYMVCVYTINRRHQAFSLLDLGVTAVFSDYPDLLGIL